uniref:Uncharacterized protein n=1 Tax=Lactuca sativa TaxID=4236 RepID=A0A9R1UTK0_LACSA|nr:hypothetical protein LSAT_V11C800445650 [Lactuca sativa]
MFNKATAQHTEVVVKSLQYPPFSDRNPSNVLDHPISEINSESVSTTFRYDIVASTGLPSRRSHPSFLDSILPNEEKIKQLIHSVQKFTLLMLLIFKSESKKPYLKSIGSLNLGGGPELKKETQVHRACLLRGVSAEEAEKMASTIDCDKLSDIGSEYEGFWIDKKPCIGMGGMIPWKLHVTGKLFHSGIVHKGDSLLIILKSFKEKQSAQSTRKLSLCMSATVDSQLFSHYFGDCPVIHARGRTHLVPTYFLEDIHDSVDYKLASDSLSSLRSNAPKQKVFYKLYISNV